MAKTYKVKLDFDAGDLKQQGGTGGGDQTQRKGGGASTPTSTAAVAGGTGLGAAAVAGAVAGGVARGGGGGGLTRKFTSFKALAADEQILKPPKGKASLASRFISKEEKLKRAEQKLKLAMQRKKRQKEEQLEKQEKRLTKSKEKIVDKEAKGDKKGGIYGGLFGKFKGLGLAGMATAIVAGAVLIAKAVLALGEKLSRFSAAMAGVMVKHELALRDFMMRAGDALAPIVEAVSQIFQILMDLLTPWFPLLKLIGVQLKAVALGLRLLSLFAPLTLILNLLKPILDRLSTFIDELNTKMENLIEKIREWLGLPAKSAGFGFIDAMRAFAAPGAGGAGGAAGGGGAAGAAGPVGAAGAIGTPGANTGPTGAMPTPVPGVNQSVYFGLNAQIQTKQHIEESIKAMREKLLMDLNKSKYESDLMLNEFKSLTYIRML